MFLGFRDWHVRYRWRGTPVVLALTLLGCSKGSVTIHGDLSEQTSTYVCNDVQNDLGGRQITVEDASGKVIGTTKATATGTSTGPKLLGKYFCSFSATYSLDVPKMDFYQMVVEGVDTQPQPISFSDLQHQHFRYDIQISGG